MKEAAVALSFQVFIVAGFPVIIVTSPSWLGYTLSHFTLIETFFFVVTCDSVDLSQTPLDVI